MLIGHLSDGLHTGPWRIKMRSRGSKNEQLELQVAPGQWQNDNLLRTTEEGPRKGRLYDRKRRLCFRTVTGHACCGKVSSLAI
jgi:hypothetical protein